MNVVIDVLLLLIIALGAYLGIKRGFIASVARPVKFFLCLIISFSLSAPIGSAIIQPIVEEPLTNQISDFIEERASGEDAEDAELPTLLRVAASLMDVDIEGLTGTEDYADALADKIALPVVKLIASVSAFILIYFLMRLLLNIGFKMLNSMFDSGVAGAVNKTLGCVFSTALAIICAWGFTVLFEFFINIPAFDNVVWMSEFNGGFIYKLLKSLNPIDLLFSF